MMMEKYEGVYIHDSDGGEIFYSNDFVEPWRKQSSNNRNVKDKNQKPSKVKVYLTTAKMYHAPKKK